MYFRTEVTTYPGTANIGVVMKTGNNEIDLRGKVQMRRKDTIDNAGECAEFKGRT